MSDPRAEARAELNRQKIAAVLSVIKEYNSTHPIKGSLVAYKAGLSSDVGVRGAVNQLRSEAEPVCSNGVGYWYACTTLEIQNTIEELEARSRSMNNAIAGLRICRDRMIRDIQSGVTKPKHTPTPSPMIYSEDLSLDDILNQAD